MCKLLRIYKAIINSKEVFIKVYEEHIEKEYSLQLTMIPKTKNGGKVLTPREVINNEEDETEDKRFSNSR